MTALIVAFGEVMPKTIAIAYPDRVSLVIAPVVLFFVTVFSPVVTAVEALVRLILRVCGFSLTETDPSVTGHEELMGAVDILHREGEVERSERDMFGGLLELSEVPVSDVMVHRTKMRLIDADLPPEELVQEAIEFALHAPAAVARRSGQHHRNPSRQGPAAGARGGRRRRDQAEDRGADARTLVRAGIDQPARSVAGLPAPQDAFRAGRRRIRRRPGPRDARGHHRGDRRRHSRRARRNRAGRSQAAGRFDRRRRRDDDTGAQPDDGLDSARRGGRHRRGPGHPRGAGDPRAAPDLRVLRLPVRGPAKAAQSHRRVAGHSPRAERGDGKGG